MPHADYRPTPLVHYGFPSGGKGLYLVRIPCLWVWLVCPGGLLSTAVFLPTKPLRSWWMSRTSFRTTVPLCFANSVLPVYR